LLSVAACRALQVGMEIEVRPGIVSRDAQGRFDCRCVAWRSVACVEYMQCRNTQWCVQC
jgi:tRNA(His) 5'-end guanylyltransferase